MEQKQNIENISINIKVVGEGEPILILHGWGGSSDKWLAFMQALSKEGYKVICPDLPGFGKSDFPPFGWKMSDYIKFVTKIMDFFELKKVHLIGHSFGGGLVIKLASMYPERIKSLILCAPAIIRKRKLTPRQNMAFHLAKWSFSVFKLVFLKKYLYPVARRVNYWIAGSSDYYFAKGTMRETFKNVTDEDLTYLLSSIESPTLIVWGTKDKAVPLSDAYLIQSKIKDSKLHIIVGANHGLEIGFPEKLSSAILGFLKS